MIPNKHRQIQLNYLYTTYHSNSQAVRLELQLAEVHGVGELGRFM